MLRLFVRLELFDEERAACMLTWPRCERRENGGPRGGVIPAETHRARPWDGRERRTSPRGRGVSGSAYSWGVGAAAEGREAIYAPWLAGECGGGGLRGPASDSPAAPARRCARLWSITDA